MGKACAMMGGFGDCTAFVNKGSKVGTFGEALTNMGYHSSGNDILYNGMTGQQLESEIFIGPTYYMRLKHMVKDKINFRARGPMTALTKQPVSGRANDGGLRIGEMERDSVVSHGIVNFLTESMMERGDKYKIAVCNTTGLLAIYNPSKNLFLSPMADGPIKFVGSLDGKDMNIENVSKFGRSFSVLSVPYSFKLLIQELQTINVQMRIITDDNINQIESMSFSRNIENLTGTMAPNVIKHKIQGVLDADKKSGLSANDAVTPSSPDFDTPDYSSPDSVNPLFDNYDNDFNASLNVPGPDSQPYVPSPDSQPYVPSPDSPPYVQMPMSMPMSVKVPSQYEVGEIVIYTGDNQEWAVEKVGTDLLTIQNDKGEQKIVGANELRANIEVGGGTGTNQPNLYFAPTINIGGMAQPSMQMQIPSMQMPEFSGGYAQVQATAPAEFSGSSAQVPIPPVDGGGIDFNNLVINKHGAV
jgi:hypothetical protein